MYTVTHKGISVNSNNISGKSSKPLEKDTKFECLQLTPLLLLDIAELEKNSASSSASCFIASNQGVLQGNSPAVEKVDVS